MSDGLKIRSVEAIPLVLPLGQPFTGGTYVVWNRNTIVVRLELESGIQGEIYGGDEDSEQEAVVNMVNRHLALVIEGRSLEEMEVLQREMMDLPVDLGYRALAALDMGRHGIQQQALSLVDIAMWDALGKFRDKPVHELLGGNGPVDLPVYSIGGYYAQDDPAPLRDEVARLRETGLAGLKMKVGRAELKVDLERVEAAVEAAGDGFGVAVDANQGWTVAQASEFVGWAKGLGIAWVEEPVKWYDALTGLAAVREKTSIPIVSGQGEISEFASCDLARYGAVDILNTDVTLVGGITSWMRVAQFAEGMGVTMGHHEEPQVAAHLLAALPSSGPVEVFADEKRDPLWRTIVKRPPEIREGWLRVPGGPGLGLELDWNAIERYRR